MIKAVLSQQPWLHDPLVSEITWRDEQEQAVSDHATSEGSGQLSFGIMRGDGLVHLQPPVHRALETVVKAIQKLGYKIIQWEPPSHERGLATIVHLSQLVFDFLCLANTIKYKAWGFDGAADGVLSIPRLGGILKKFSHQCVRSHWRAYGFSNPNQIREIEQAIRGDGDCCCQRRQTPVSKSCRVLSGQDSL